MERLIQANRTFNYYEYITEKEFENIEGNW